MNYDKLSCFFCYYYEKGIMQKVVGECYVYKFVCSFEVFFSMVFFDLQKFYIKLECWELKFVSLYVFQQFFFMLKELYFKLFFF